MHALKKDRKRKITPISNVSFIPQLSSTAPKAARPTTELHPLVLVIKAEAYIMCQGTCTVPSSHLRA